MSIDPLHYTHSRSQTVLGPVPSGMRWQDWIRTAAIERFGFLHPDISFVRNASGLNLHEFASVLEGLANSPVSKSTNCTCAHSPRREAYVISLNPNRLAEAAHTLHDAGFKVKHVMPVDTVADPRVLALERRYRIRGDKAAPLGAISNLLTHIDLWHAAPAATADEAWTYIFEDDVMLHPSVTAAHVQCVLDGVEAFAGNHSLLYLGSASEHRRGRPQALRLPCGAAARPHTLQACAPLAFHAYAVRRSTSRSLWELIRYVVGPQSDIRKYPGYRYTVDIATRAYYWRGEEMHIISPEAEWPRCLNVHMHGIFQQNASADASRALRHNWTAGFWRRRKS